ncbi:MAG: hypothetical protein IKN27_01390 [Selenomonadaceae bacterium]|nr:hypothetical protein [Selenomonadaceae bacterium]
MKVKLAKLTLEIFSHACRFYGGNSKNVGTNRRADYFLRQWLFDKKIVRSLRGLWKFFFACCRIAENFFWRQRYIARNRFDR